MHGAVAAGLRQGTPDDGKGVLAYIQDFKGILEVLGCITSRPSGVNSFSWIQSILAISGGRTNTFSSGQWEFAPTE